MDGDELTEATGTPPVPPAPEGVTHTSADLTERPFVVDGVPVTEAQLQRISNLVAGTGRGAREAMDLRAALDLWRRQNHLVTLPSGKSVWKVHSNSETYRESESEETRQGPLHFRAQVREAVADVGPRGSLWDIVLIQEGWSLNGRYYSRGALEGAVQKHLFEGSKICDYGYGQKDDHDHIPLDVREQIPGGVPARNIIGFVDDVRGEERGGRFQIVGRFHCTDAHRRELLSESWEAGHRDFLGFSIDAVGAIKTGVAEGRRGYIVESIDHVFETTLVSEPAAGGRLARLVASNTRRPTMGPFGKMMRFVVGRLPADKREDAKALRGQRLAESFSKNMITALREDSADSAQAILLDVVQQLLKTGEVEIAQMILGKVQSSVQGEVSTEGDGGDGDMPVDEAFGSGDDQAEKRCATCGTENPPDADACVSCGAPLTENAGSDMFEARETSARKREELLKNKKGGQRMDRMAESMKSMQKALQEANATARSAVETAQLARVSLCEARLTAMLVESKLPEQACGQLRKQWSGKVFEDGALRESIEDMRTFLADVGAKAATGGEVENPGQARVEVVREARDLLQARLDLMLGYEPQEARDEKHIRESNSKSIKPLLVKGKVYDGVRGFKTLKEAYTAITDDPNVSGIYGDNSPYAQALRTGGLREATETSFSYALGVAMTRRMLQDYLDFPQVWRDIVTIDPNVDNFKTQDRILWGGFGNLPTVSEVDTGYAYPTLGFPYQAQTQYYVVTRGGMVRITRKMIIDDDLNALLKLASKLGRGANLTLQRFVFSLLLGASGGTLNGDNMFDSNPIYCSQHRNYSTNGLSYNELVASRQRLREQYEYANPIVLASGYTAGAGTMSINADKGGPNGSVTGLQVGDLIQFDSEILSVTAVDAPSGGASTVTVTGAQLGTTAANHSSAATGYQLGDAIELGGLRLIVPTNLEATALQILGSQWVPGSANNDTNFLYNEAQSGRIKPIVVPAAYFRALQNSFVLQVDPKSLESIELAFLNNRQEPEILVQDTPTVGYVFEGDLTSYKLRHEYGGAVVDWRGLSGNISS